MSNQKAKKKGPTELEIVALWRKEFFQSVIKDSKAKGIGPKTILSLVSSTASPHDLRRLIESGCEPKTAIKILV